MHCCQIAAIAQRNLNKSLLLRDMQLTTLHSCFFSLGYFCFFVNKNLFRIYFGLFGIAEVCNLFILHHEHCSRCSLFLVLLLLTNWNFWTFGSWVAASNRLFWKQTTWIFFCGSDSSKFTYGSFFILLLGCYYVLNKLLIWLSVNNAIQSGLKLETILSTNLIITSLINQFI